MINLTSTVHKRHFLNATWTKKNRFVQISQRLAGNIPREIYSTLKFNK